MIVITGGAGFIGSALVLGLNQRDITDILVVDELGTDEKWKNLVNLEFSDYIEKDDFIIKIENKKLNYIIDGIIHMGACSSTTENDAGFLIKNNYEYSKRLALWCDKNNKRFVYASSAATYGDGKLTFSDEHSLLPKFKPLNMYGYSKHLFDMWALHNGLLEKIAGLKYFNVFGPNEYHKADMRSVVHKAFGQIMSTGKMKLFKSYNSNYKDGWQLRDFLYIKDAVDMTLFIYYKPEGNGIFNIGTGKARSFYDLVTAVFNAVGKEQQIEYIDMPESIRGKYQYFTQADIKKIYRLDYDKKMFTLEEAVSDYIKSNLMTDEIYLS